MVPGSGVAAELLAKNGVTIYGESRIEELLKDAGKESFTLRRAHLGDETVLAFIQTEAWKAAFQEFLRTEDISGLTSGSKTTFFIKAYGSGICGKNP